MSDKKVHYIIGGLIFIASLTVYLQTMAASVSFWDSGEFIATSYILGIPHSPGTPLYVLVGRVFTLFPLSISAAQKVNLLSAVFGALGVLMAYLIIAEIVSLMLGSMKNGIEKFIHYTGPAAGALYLTFSDTYWWNATEAEVYSLSTFLMGLSILLALKWYRNPSGEIPVWKKQSIIEKKGKKEGEKIIVTLEEKEQKHSRNLVLFIIYLFSLGIGFHLGTILASGGIFLLFLMVKKKSFSNFEFFVFGFGMAVIIADMTMYKNSMITIVGLLILTVLLIWSYFSEGKFAITATALFVLGLSVHLFLYIRSGLNPMIDEVDPETWRALYAHLRREQYPPMNIFARKASLLFQFQHFWGYFREQFRMIGDVTMGSFNLGKASVVIPIGLGLYGISSNFCKERKSWVVNFTALALNSIGLILFLNFSDHEVRERDYFYGGAFYFFSIFIGIGASAFLMMLRDYFKTQGAPFRRWTISAGVLIIVLSIFPAKYHWFEHNRSNNYIARDYAYNMLAGLEPDAIIFTNGDNDTFPLWYIQCVESFRNDVIVANLSLLNTNWYIKQLRDQKPGTPIMLSDHEIEKLNPIKLKDGSVAWKRDRAVQHIIRNALWERPVYFAVTVPKEVWKPYEQHLEMEGMVRKIVPYKGEHLLNEFMMARNFDDIFKYRGVLTDEKKKNTSVFKNKDTKTMFINFSVAAFQLAQERARSGDYEKAAERAELSMEFNSSFDYAKKYLGIYYVRNGQLDKAVKHYEKLIKNNPERGDYFTGLVAVYREADKPASALNAVDTGISKVPNERDLYAYGFQIALGLGHNRLAKSYIEKWLVNHPEDPEFNSLNRSFRETYDEPGVDSGSDSAK